MGNLTHIDKRDGSFSVRDINTFLSRIHSLHFNDAVRFVPRPELAMALVSDEFHGSWMLRDKKGNNVFDFYLESPMRLGFHHSFYGAWGDWARLLTIEALAATSDGVIWDDSCGQSESWFGDPFKYWTFKKFVKQRLTGIPKGLRTIYRLLAWLSKPKGVLA